MTQLNPQVHAHNSNVAYQYPAWEQSNKSVQIDQKLLNVPSGLVTDLRTTLDAAVMSREPESVLDYLVSDLRRFLKFSSSENVLTEMKEVTGEQLKEKFGITPEKLKAALESAPDVMTGEQFQEKYGFTPEKVMAASESAPNVMTGEQLKEKFGITPEKLKAALESAPNVMTGEQFQKKYGFTPEKVMAASESAPNVMTGEQLKEKFGITPEKLKAALESAPDVMTGEQFQEKYGFTPEKVMAASESAPNVMTGEQFKEKFGISLEKLSAQTLAETKVLSTDDQRLVSSLAEHLKNNPDTPVLGDKLYSGASEVVANLRRYLDAEASGENVDSAARHLSSSLQVLFGTDNSKKR
ncbi:Clp protease N-terminal domain-containing protein [Pseudomonas canadensis]|uniref:Clp protease N-terminal domain-containing protein n=1 Tax=Pseudomonas canadensis TaxID=915099 RepID=UPI0030CF24C2